MGVIGVRVVLPTSETVRVMEILRSLPLSNNRRTLRLLITMVPTMNVSITVTTSTVRVVRVSIRSTITLGTTRSRFRRRLVYSGANFYLGVYRSLDVREYGRRPYYCRYRGRSFRGSLLFGKLLLRLFVSNTGVREVTRGYGKGAVGRHVVFPGDVKKGSHGGVMMSFVYWLGSLWPR